MEKVELEFGITLYCGDCLEVLPTLEKNSIDSVVTDPPYGIVFMSKGWDKSVPGKDFWDAVRDASKPGAMLFSFGGTRTFHRLACDIEDAGWEIRDCVEWVYGCLSEDTEILTSNGWVHYHKNIKDDLVLCYNIETNEYCFDKPIRSFYYDNKYTAYRIRSDKTDQLVSRNHRCVVEREGKLLFELAEEASQKQEICVPILESLRDLPETISDIQSHTSIKKQDLFAAMQYEISHIETSEERSERFEGNDFNKVPCLRERNMEAEVLAETGKASYMLDSMQWEREGKGSYKTQSQRGCGVDYTELYQLCGENVWTVESGLERRSDLLPQTRQLQTSKICQMPERLYSDGEERRICYGTSPNSCERDGEMPFENGDSSPYGPQSRKQRHYESDVICKQSRSQTIRGERIPSPSVAEITPVEYKGKVWCVQVPTGAFVARRNGKIFITGNSGFPKSLDISKQMDKDAGVEREVIGIDVSSIRPNNEKNHQNGQVGDFKLKSEGAGLITAPATDNAKLWDGWGTALKPAFEPVIVAVKPFAISDLWDMVKSVQKELEIKLRESGVSGEIKWK